MAWVTEGGGGRGGVRQAVEDWLARLVDHLDDREVILEQVGHAAPRPDWCVVQRLDHLYEVANRDLTYCCHVPDCTVGVGRDQPGSGVLVCVVPGCDCQRRSLVVASTF